MGDGGCTLLVGGSGKGKDWEYLAVEKFYLYQGEENGRWTKEYVNNTLEKSVGWSVHICGDICSGPNEITFDLNDLTTEPNFPMHVKDHVITTDYGRESSTTNELGSIRPSKVLVTEATTIFTIDLEDIDISTRESASNSELGSIRPNKVIEPEVTTIFTIDLEDLDLDIYTTESPITVVSTAATFQSPKVTEHNKGNLVSAGSGELQSTTRYRRESTSHSELIFTEPNDDLATTEVSFTVDVEDLHTTESPAIIELAGFPVDPSQSTTKDSQHTDEGIEDLLVIETEDGETTTEYRRESKSNKPTVSLLPEPMSATPLNELVFTLPNNDNNVLATEATTVFMLEIDLADLKTTESPVLCNGDYCVLPS